MTMYADHWSQAAARCHQAGQAYVILTLLQTTGSTPRDSGSKMLVTDADTFDSIGGGTLELLAIDEAREMLQSGMQSQVLKHFPLGAEARQCCGGSVAVLFESFQPAGRSVVLFGAGHVARSLLQVLPESGFLTLCVDNRKDMLGELSGAGSMRTWHREDPVAAVSELDSNAHVLVMTHEHNLDFKLVTALLSDWRWASVGLIGSRTKAARFRHRLHQSGFSEADIDRLQCPVGLPDLKGKRPMEVAVSITADLLRRFPEEKVRSDSWRDMRRELQSQQVEEFTE